MTEERAGSITLVFNGLPVSVNAAWRMGGRKWFRSKTYTDYIEGVSASLLLMGKPVCPWSDIQVTVWFFPPDRRKYDADNRSKTLFDALTQAGFWTDDSIVTRVDCRRGAVAKGGLTVVKVEPPQVQDTDGLPQEIVERIAKIREIHKKVKRRKNG